MLLLWKQTCVKCCPAFFFGLLPGCWFWSARQVLSYINRQRRVQINHAIQNVTSYSWPIHRRLRQFICVVLPLESGFRIFFGILILFFSGMGYWSQSACPGGMNFDFMTQACKYGNPTVHENTVRKDDLLNIGKLNYNIYFIIFTNF